MDEWDDVRKQIGKLEDAGGHSDPLSEVSRLSVADYWKRKFDESRRQWETENLQRDREKAKLKEGYREEERTVLELGARLRELEMRMEWERLLWEEKSKVKILEVDYDKKKNEAELRLKSMEQDNEALKARLKGLTESLEEEQRKRLKTESEKMRVEESARTLEMRTLEAGAEDRVKAQFLERERDALQRRFEDLQVQLIQSRAMLALVMPMSGGVERISQDAEEIHKMIEEKARDAEDFSAHENEHLKTLEDLGRGFAHKVRNYLGIISGTLEMCLSNHKLEDALKNDLSLVNKNAQEMLKSIEDYLGLTKVPEMTFETVPAADFLNIALDAAEAAAKTAGVLIERKIPVSLPSISVDSAMLKEAVVQILDNAVEAAASGQKIKVSAKQDADKGRVVITVSDQGRGADASEAEKVFRPFFTTKKGRKGLGLFVAKRAVDIHRGFIRFESVKNQGSTVTVSLPVLKKQG